MKRIIPRIEEQLRVEKRTVETGRTRIRKQVRSRTEHVEVPLQQEDVEIVRVAVNRPVDAPVPTRQEDDRTIIPVHKEITVVTKQLVLVEEIHLVRRVSQTNASTDITLLSEEIEISRQASTLVGNRAQPDAPQRGPM